MGTLEQEFSRRSTNNICRNNQYFEKTPWILWQNLGECPWKVFSQRYSLSKEKSSSILIIDQITLCYVKWVGHWDEHSKNSPSNLQLFSTLRKHLISLFSAFSFGDMVHALIELAFSRSRQKKKKTLLNSLWATCPASNSSWTKLERKSLAVSKTAVSLRADGEWILELDSPGGQEHNAKGIPVLLHQHVTCLNQSKRKVNS